jgi:hypothetical protein
MRIPDALVKGALISENGYEISPAKTKWVRINPDNDLKNKVDALFRLKNTNTKSNATFSVRVDKDTAFTNLNDYANKWLKSYGQFGIEVLGHQYFKNAQDQKGMVIDLANSSSHKKLRQVIFFKENRAVVLTCMDQADKFISTLKECNDLIRSFVWIESVPNTGSKNLEQKL